MLNYRQNGRKDFADRNRSLKALLVSDDDDDDDEDDDNKNC